MTKSRLPLSTLGRSVETHDGDTQLNIAQLLLNKDCNLLKGNAIIVLELGGWVILRFCFVCYLLCRYMVS